jgi:RNA polymerase sigma factor (sigma-70 family)
MAQTQDPQDTRTAKKPHATLGEVLYAGGTAGAFAEADWACLVQSLAAGDRHALNKFYARTHRVIFTLLMRLTSSASITEELMVEVYGDVWRGKRRHDPAKATVLAWLMNEARARAIARLRTEQRKHWRDAWQDSALMAIDGPSYQDLMEAKEGLRRLKDALRVLVPEERSAIECAFFDELSLAEIATRSRRPEPLVRARLRSGLHTLRHALGAGAKDALSVREINACECAELVCAHLLRALPSPEADRVEAHLASCRSCRRESESLGCVVASFHFWPTDVRRSPVSVQERVVQRVVEESDGLSGLPSVPERRLEWEEVASGISCKILATDERSDMVSMLVRLAPGGEYPPHTHAGVEELHLLDGELWIDDRKLHPGDYNRAEPGTNDKRVWSETGCTCFLVTSAKDVLGQAA